MAEQPEEKPEPKQDEAPKVPESFRYLNGSWSDPKIVREWDELNRF